jgi:hypothetical protein
VWREKPVKLKALSSQQFPSPTGKKQLKEEFTTVRRAQD